LTNSNIKKQTTTKKSRYDDSYLSENGSPIKANEKIEILGMGTNFEIPEDEEISGSS
jgi:hypothetical protein